MAEELRAQAQNMGSTPSRGLCGEQPINASLSLLMLLSPSSSLILYIYIMYLEIIAEGILSLIACEV